ncbi:MAG: BON domain-containing protein [Pirellulaceae bacterium]|nr:BON domain-containing protein [Planctomycetales bacterium]MCA9265361.1 BON domain-containing protein [Planctomycetales bacterium]
MTTTVSNLCERANSALATSNLYSLRNLRVELTSDDSLMITGLVSTFYQKQQAQEIVRATVDGQPVINAVEVR